MRLDTNSNEDFKPLGSTFCVSLSVHPVTKANPPDRQPIDPTGWAVGWALKTKTKPKGNLNFVSGACRKAECH